MASWCHRTVLAGLLLTAYLCAWTPARTAAVQYGVAPMLAAVTNADTTVSSNPAAHTVRLQPATAEDITYRAPAGVKFLLPGLFLILVRPTRPCLGAFFTGHLALGGLILLTIGIAARASVPEALPFANFVQQYGVDTYSLAVPVLLFARNRSPQGTSP